ncbi:MAG: OmpH family outer membrane protein [Saprospiraceae bacterium]|nr:OmpH family outer membrane protein [Saprospiraceae bacterium]
MNYSKKTILTFFLAAFVMVATTTAQKFGHINSQQLLVESPLVKQADAELKTFQEGLITKGQTMVSTFEKGYNAYVAEVQAGGLSKVQMSQRESELAKSQEAIQRYEVEVQQKIAVKREELYKPILDKAKVAIDAIGKEGSYTMIFDTGTNGLLFAEESEDLLPKVKAKLGW